MKARNVPERRVRGLPIQLKYAVLLTLTAAVCTLLMIFVMAWFIQRNYSLFMGDELGVSSQVVAIVKQEQRLLEISLLGLFVLSITVTFAASFYVTRKLTGPIVALQRQLLLFSRGDYTREFRLRRHDEFKELEALMNLVRENQLAGDSMQKLQGPSSGSHSGASGALGSHKVSAG